MSAPSSKETSCSRRPRGSRKQTNNPQPASNPETLPVVLEDGHAASADDAKTHVSPTKNRRVRARPSSSAVPPPEIESSLPTTTKASPNPSNTKSKKKAVASVEGSSSGTKPASSTSDPKEVPSEGATRTPTTSSPVSVTVSAPESSSESFNPRSIVPDTKGKKTLASLRQNLSSQANTFRCIDGVSRTTDPNKHVCEDETPAPMFDRLMSAPSADTADNRDRNQQFRIMGIDAYPTIADNLSVCYDFVSPMRWCQWGNRCHRIHPLDKRAYLAMAIKEKVQHVRMMKAAAENAESQQIQNLPTHSLPAEPAPVQANSRVPRPHYPLSSDASTSSASTVRHGSTISDSASSSSGGVNNRDTESGSQSNHSSSSSSSSSSSRSGSSSGSPRTPCSEWWDSGADDVSMWIDNDPPEKKAAAQRDWDERVKKGLILNWNYPPVYPVKTSPEVVRHPRPRNSELCPKYLKGKCNLGYDCIFVHENLIYDDDTVPDMTPPQPMPRGPESHDAVMHGHMRFKVGAGFAVEGFSTGFESPVIFVANLPSMIQDSALSRLLSNYGEVVEIRRPPGANQPQGPLSVRVEFTKSEDAYRAFTSLHNTRHFNRDLEVRMALQVRQNGSVIKDTVVQIEWEYAHRTVYMGYASEELAEQAAARARHILYNGEYQTTAHVYIGIPAVGEVTVKFDWLPPNVTAEGMKVFGDHQGMVTASSSYEDYTLPDTIMRIRRLLKQFKDTMTDVDFKPAPYRNGKMRAWAYFKTPNEAALAASNLHGRKPVYTGRNRISARHIKTISFSLNSQKYQMVARDLHDLAQKIWRQNLGYNLTVTEKSGHVNLRLCGENMKTLGMLKAEVERTLNGEPVLEDGKVAWDDYFKTPSGASFLRDLEHEFPGVTIQRDLLRRTIRIFGHWARRPWVRQRILFRIKDLEKRKWHRLPVDARVVTQLSLGKIDEMKQKYGAENISLDTWNHQVRVRGDEEMLTHVSDEVNVVRMRLLSSPYYAKKVLKHECPVCLNEASPAVHLGCGHTFCRGCLKRYLLASVDHKFFPLKCLGAEGKCEDRIPLPLAKQLLPPDSFNAIVEAAFSAHIHTHSKEFHYCPTPDCPQVYRAAKEGVFLQCPSCLVRLCPSCHSDAHDGLSCAEAGSGDDLFQEWADKNGVKQCPTCKIGIQKAEGCNHMVCSVCNTHICWVCFKTFPKGAGIYDHMHDEHGGIGLGEN